jgi:hypothetical protein
MIRKYVVRLFQQFESEVPVNWIEHKTHSAAQYQAAAWKIANPGMHVSIEEVSS